MLIYKTSFSVLYSIILYSLHFINHNRQNRSSPKFHAVKLYRTCKDVRFVCRRYKVSKSSLMRWNKRFDGAKASLVDKPTDLRGRTQMPIQSKNSNRFRIITGAPLPSQSTSCTGSCVPKKAIPMAVLEWKSPLQKREELIRSGLYIQRDAYRVI